jgi:hypothetical protein
MTHKPSETADVFYVVMDASATAPTHANVLAEATYAGDKTSWLAHGKATFDGLYPAVSLSGLSAGRPKCYCATYAFQQEGKEKLCWKKTEDKCYSTTSPCDPSGICWGIVRALTMYYVVRGDQYKNEVFDKTGLSTSLTSPDCVSGSTFNAGTGKAPCAACAAAITCTNGTKAACTATTDTVCNTASVCPSKDTAGWRDSTGINCAEYATGVGGTSVNAQSNCVQVRTKVAEMRLSPFVVVVFTL